MCIRDRIKTAHLVSTDIGSNTRIAADKRTIVIENKREQTFIITDDNSNTIINTREECKIQSKHSYRVGENIQSSRYTQTLVEQLKKVTQVKQITRDEGTHSNYRLNDSCNDNHNNYNYKHYSDYYNTPMQQKRNKVYVNTRTAHVSLTQANTGCVRQERGSRRECILPTAKEKMVLTSDERTFTAVQWDVNTIQWSFNESNKQNGNVLGYATKK